MDNYEDFLKGINSQDREDKNSKIINEFKAFLKLNASVYNTFAGVKAEIDNILNNPISVDEAEYYQKLFPSFFEHLKDIKADLSFFPEYTFVPEYQNLIDKHYKFIMRDMTLAEAETTRQRMLQLLEENKQQLPNYFRSLEVEKQRIAQEEDIKINTKRVLEFPDNIVNLIKNHIKSKPIPNYENFVKDNYENRIVTENKTFGSNGYEESHLFDIYCSFLDDIEFNGNEFIFRSIDIQSRLYYDYKSIQNQNYPKITRYNNKLIEFRVKFIDLFSQRDNIYDFLLARKKITNNHTSWSCSNTINFGLSYYFGDPRLDEQFYINKFKPLTDDFNLSRRNCDTRQLQKYY